MRNNWTVKQVTRQDFTWDEIYKAYTDHDRSFAETAKALTQLGRGKVSRQLVRYWINSEDFSDVNEEHFEARQLVAKQRAQDTSRHLRREIRELSRAIDTQEEWEASVLQGIEQIVDRAPQVFTPVSKLERDDKATRGLTVEVLVSDVQVGKLTSNYNSDIARNRMRELGESAAEAISQKISAGFHIERILLVFLGDLIESDEKHNDSAVGCDSSTSEQMANFTEWAFHYILKPLAPLTEHLDVVGIAGNHDWNGNGMRSVRPGRTQLSFPIYKGLEMLCRYTIPHCTWTIPEGVFHVDKIYGTRVLYEHGVGVSVTEAALKKRKHDRSEQVGEHIFYFRMG